MCLRLGSSILACGAKFKSYSLRFTQDSTPASPPPLPWGLNLQPGGKTPFFSKAATQDSVCRDLETEVEEEEILKRGADNILGVSESDNKRAGRHSEAKLSPDLEQFWALEDRAWGGMPAMTKLN
jgi:hypothetical protein